MNTIEIILIILGIIIIIISCRLVESKTGDKKNTRGILAQEVQLSEEDLRLKREQLEELLTQISDDFVEKTEDELSRLSNEKIMAVGEYSDQILEKINHNHEEVVFLYHMLNEKEKELKSAIREVDHSQKTVHLPDSNKLGELEASVATVLPIQQSNMQAAIGKAGIVPTKEPKVSTEGFVESTDDNENNNARILELYSKGKSIVEISKLLELGQGEVKLVIDLFRGRM